MKLVATTFRDDIEDAARCFSVVGAIGACLDFNFLDKLERQVGAPSPECGVGRVDAVKNVIVLWS